MQVKLQQCCCHLLPSEEEARAAALLLFLPVPNQTKANGKAPLKERISKLRAGIKASADSIYPNPCLLFSLKNPPMRTEKPHKVSFISHTFLKYWLKPPWKNEGLQTLGLSPNPQRCWDQGRQLGQGATPLPFPDKWGSCLVPLWEKTGRPRGVKPRPGTLTAL